MIEGITTKENMQNLIKDINALEATYEKNKKKVEDAIAKAEKERDKAQRKKNFRAANEYSARIIKLKLDLVKMKAIMAEQRRKIKEFSLALEKEAQQQQEQNNK